MAAKWAELMRNTLKLASLSSAWPEESQSIVPYNKQMDRALAGVYNVYPD